MRYCCFHRDSWVLVQPKKYDPWFSTEPSKYSLHRRVEVVAEPRLVLRAHQVAAGLVDREGRIPRDVALHHPVDDLVQLRRVGLRVQLASAAEAVDLVRVVHLRRERLDAGQRRVGDTVEVFDRVDAQVDVVVGGGLFDRDVRRRAQPEGVGLVHDRLELIAIHADDLQAVGALLLHLADPRTDLGGRSGATLADERVHQNPGRDDRVRVAFRLPLLRLVEIAADFTRRGHPGGEVQVALVLNRLRHARLTLFMPVHVGVDDAGHHVLAGGVDHRVRCRRERRRVRRPGDGRDQPILYDDVHRSVRRLGVAVDDHGIPDDETTRRSCVNRRCRLDRLGGSGSECRQCDECESCSEDLHESGSSSGLGPTCDGKVPICRSR